MEKSILSNKKNTSSSWKTFGNVGCKQVKNVYKDVVIFNFGMGSTWRA